MTTQRKAASQPALLPPIVDALAVTVCVVSLDGVLLQTNRAALEWPLGNSDALIGGNILEHLPTPNDARRFAEALGRVRAGETAHMEIEFFSRAGAFFAASLAFSPFYTAEGELCCALITITDVTEDRQNQRELLRITAQLEAQRQRLRYILANVPGIVWEQASPPTDSLARINFVSDYAEQMLGYAREEWLTTPNFWSKIIEPEDQPSYFAQLAHLYTSPASATFTFRCLAKDGRVIPVEQHITIVTNDRGEASGMYGLMTDITARREAEAALEQYSMELKRSNQELQQFAYIASHDLQEPLRMVTSYLQLLESRYNDKLDDDARDFIQFAVDGASRMKHLIQDLLQYSRVQSRPHVFTDVNMNDVLAQVKANLSVSIEESGGTVDSDPLPHITADEGRMVQLMQNLIGNALKFRSAEPPRVTVRAVEKAKEWVFSVADNGIGIQKQYLERIFIIFQRLHGKARYPGTGIGLAICKKVVENHGGRIWVESEYGNGTTFYFTMPKVKK